MCFGGKGGGGHQGGGSSREDGEVRKAHRKAGISSAETRRYFREKENPAHSRNENAAGATTSVSHSRDEGGNLVAKRVEYGQGNFADGSMKAENILGKRDDVFQVGSDLSVGGTIFKNAKLSKSGNSILSTDPNNVGTMGGITSGGGLWGGNKIKSVLGVTDGVGAVNSRGIGTSLITPVLAAQNLSRTEKYQERSDLFKNSTPAEIEAIRAANRKKNPADQDGDGSWLTSTDNMGRVYGIGSKGDGSGAQGAIYDPTLPEGYRGIPQVDPNKAFDPNLTMFGKGMRTVGKPVLGALGFGLPVLAEKLDQKGFIPNVLKGNTGRGTDIEALEDLKTTPLGEITRGDNFTYAPTRFATSDQNAPNPFTRDLNMGSLGGIEPETNNIGASSNGALPTTETYSTSNINRPILRPTGITASDVGEAKTPTFYDMFGDSKFQTTAERAKMSDVQPNSVFNRIDALKYFEGDKYTEDSRKLIDRLYGSRWDQKNLSSEETGSPSSSRFVNYAYNDSGSDDNDSPYITTTQNMTSDNEQSIYDRFNYRKYVPTDPTFIGQSSYGGKFGSGQPNYMASVSPAGIYSDGTAGSAVMTPFFNSTTGQYFEAPSSNFYAEAGSNWRRGTPTEAYNLPIVA